MKSKTVISSIIGTLLCTTAVAEVHVQDVNGWGKVKWGMTVQQAKAALDKQASEPTPEQAKKGSQEHPVRLLVNDLKIDDLPATAFIQTTLPSDTVSWVQIEFNV